MLNEFGKFTRKLRVDKSERMADMAAKLGISSAFLSSIELGKKPIPSTIVQAIINAYNLDEINALALKGSIAQSCAKFIMEPKTANGKRVASALYDRVDNLTVRQGDFILEILNGGPKENKILINFPNADDIGLYTGNTRAAMAEMLVKLIQKRGKADQS